MASRDSPKGNHSQPIFTRRRRIYGFPAMRVPPPVTESNGTEVVSALYLVAGRDSNTSQLMGSIPSTNAPIGNAELSTKLNTPVFAG